MGTISLVQVRLGIFRPTVRFSSAIIRMTACGTSSVSNVSTALKPPAIAAQALANSAGMLVRISCTLSFARSACQGFTGSDWSSHRFLPSREIEGAAISFMEATTHTAVHSSTAALPG